MNRLFFAAAFLMALVPKPAAATSFTPSPNLRYGLSAKELLDDCRAAKADAEAALEAVARGHAAGRTFDDTPWALDRIASDLADRTASDSFLKNVAISSAVRDAGTACETLLGQFSVDMYAREDLYRVLQEYASKGETLDAEAKRLVEKQLLGFKRSGLQLPKEKREAVTALRKKLVELGAAFGKNIAEQKDFVLFDAAELKGLPEAFLARLERVDGKLKVSLDYPDYYPVMDDARSATARRTLEAKFSDRAAANNAPLLNEMLALRLKAANLLGYETHAQYILEDRMAGNPKTVRAFIARLRAKLKILGGEQLAALKALKAIDEPGDASFNAWDWRYYANQLRMTKYAVDQQKVKEYFPTEIVTERMLSVYQALLGLKFRRVEDAAVWHPDVNLYEVSDAAGGEPIGWFYLDLFPREGKFKHAAAFQLISGRALSGNRYQKPVAALVVNFSKASKDRPALLSHAEIETFFHEFGHIMHQTLTKARYGRFSGTSTARDFVEAPSQMLQNWAWDGPTLRSLSGHYLDASKKLPEDLLAQMLAARNADSGLYNSRQLMLAAVDQDYHGAEAPDTTAAYSRLAEDIALIPVSKGTHPEAALWHLIGYDAQIYGYLWSRVYAQDMFARFEAEGVTNQALGRRYRTEILERGSSRDEMDSLKAFLGREPKEDAFLTGIGLKP